MKNIDFFKENSAAIEAAEKAAEKALNTNDENEESDDDDDSAAAPLVISTKEQAEEQRGRLDTKVKGDDLPLPIGSFQDLRGRFQLHKHLLRNLERQNFSNPTPIQSEAIPTMLHGRDLVACAPTGSGKTLAFGIPIVQALKQHESTGIRCLVITPTKELATQIYAQFIKLSQGRDLNICVLNKSQANKFANETNKRKFDILISTPLRLLALTGQGKLDLSRVKHVVLDEVDKLFEQGFIQQTDSILEQCTAPDLQRAMFSATIPAGVEEIANNIMFSPVRVIVGKKEGANTQIDQKLVYTGSEHGKLIEMRRMLQEGELEPPVIVFVQSVARAKALFHELIYDGVNVDVIHGERTQTQRDKVIEHFKNGDIWLLICTDVLARGIDFRGVSLVINYDVPESAQAYVHRIGRTGRAGRTGKAVTFYTKEDGVAVKSVVNVMKQSGCEVPEWMVSLRKATTDEKKRLKSRPIDRDGISTMPKAVKQTEREKKEKENATKKRKKELKKERKAKRLRKDSDDDAPKKSILDEDSDSD